MTETLTIEHVERALQQPLPGLTAQLRMSTRPRSTPEEFEHPRPPRQGGVLILLYPIAERIFLPLTRRTDRVANHKGQIALPGGAREAEDASLWETALREAAEEIAVDPAQVRYIGRLTPLYIPPSNFDVYPFVGYVPTRPSFAPDPDEVAELIEMPLETILDASAKGEETRIWRGSQIRVPFYRYQQHQIWGATAMVLSELEAALLAASRTDASASAQPKTP